MLTLVALLVAAQTPQHWLQRQPNLPQSTGAPLPFFSAFTASGAGTFGACSTTPPTGSKGEVLTFTRASSATCSKKGLATTGIQPGDFVTMASSQPRVEPGGGGVLRGLREPARTSSLLRSAEFDDAAWIKTNSGVAAPTVTANQAVAPDGTTTADRVQVNACPVAGNYSVVLQTAAVLNPTGSVYLRGVSGGGSVTVFNRDAGASASVVCAYVSTSWTRCSVPFTTAASTQFGFGCLNTVAPIGGTDTGAADFFAWGAQYESGTYATSYIATTSASATRAVDVWRWDLGASAPAANSMSLAITVEGKQATDTDAYPHAIAAHSDSFASPSGKGLWLYSNVTAGASMRCLATNEGGSSFATGASAASSGTVRGWCASSGTVTGDWAGALTASGATSGTWNPARYVALSGTSSSTMYGLFGDVCIGAPARCR